MGAPRPWWMSFFAAVCFAALVYNVPRDLFLAEARGVEVWFGIDVHGNAARFTAPIHWLIFGVGAFGFWRCRPWALPLAATYVFYVALSHLIWSEASVHGRGWAIGLAQALGISMFGVLLLWLRGRRNTRRLFGPSEGAG